MKVNFSNLTGEKKSVWLGFSFPYFFLGPLYLLFKRFIFRFLIITPIYILGIWTKGGVLLADWLNTLGITQEFTNFLTFPNTYKIYSYVALGLIHLILCVCVPRLQTRKLFKKSYVPFSELDTQKLIKHRLAKVGTLSYLSSFAPVNGVNSQIKVKNDKELAYHLEQLTNLLKSGMISKDEYNDKRAMIVMEKK